MKWFSDRGSTPLTSTIHSHVPRDISKNASWSIFPDHEAFLVVMGSIVKSTDFSYLFDVSNRFKTGYSSYVNAKQVLGSKITKS